MASIRDTWSDYTHGRRWSLAVSMVIGVGLFGCGVAGDIPGWWSGLGFAPNAVTSLSGFFVGVPIALVLLSTISAEREEKSQIDKVEALSAAAWADYSHKVTAFCSDERIAALNFAGAALADRWDDYRMMCLYFTDIFKNAENYKPPSDELFDELVTALPEMADNLEHMVNDHVLSAVPNQLDAETKWLSLVRSWSLLDTYVKVQRFERNLDWLPEDLDTRIQQKMLHAASPFKEFLDLHKEYGELENCAGIANMPEYFRTLASIGRKEALEVLNDRGEPIWKLTSGECANSAFDTKDFLLSLRDDVAQAETNMGGSQRAVKARRGQRDNKTLLTPK
jgi:hypothetical protein